MAFYFLRANFTVEGFKNLHKTSAVELQDRLSALVDKQRGESVTLYFVGTDFGIYLIIEAFSSLLAKLMMSTITSEWFVEGVSSGRLLSVDEAEAVAKL